MRSVRSQRELQLDKRLVRIKLISIAREPVLPTNLRKLARPIGQHYRPSLVIQVGVKCTVRSVNPSPHEPAPGKLVIRRCIEAETVLRPRGRVRWPYNDLARADPR